jgi:uncharacterized membrane protein
MTPGALDTSLGTYGVWILIAAMTAVTYGVRAGGFWLMSHVPLTPRVRRMLEALPGAVVISTVLPLVVREGFIPMVAIAAAVAVMAFRRNDLLAVICGIGVAALGRLLMP